MRYEYFRIGKVNLLKGKISLMRKVINNIFRILNGLLIVIIMILDLNILLPHPISNKHTLPGHLPLNPPNNKLQKLIKLILPPQINNQSLNLFLTH